MVNEKLHIICGNCCSLITKGNKKIGEENLIELIKGKKF